MVDVKRIFCFLFSPSRYTVSLALIGQEERHLLGPANEKPFNTELPPPIEGLANRAESTKDIKIEDSTRLSQ